MTANAYTNGQGVTITVAFRDVDGLLADPSDVSLVIKDPHGVATTYTYAAHQVQKDGTGSYHYDLTPGTDGYWVYRWFSTAGIIAAFEGSFSVTSEIV